MGTEHLRGQWNLFCGEQERKLESFQENTNPRGEPRDKTPPTTVLEINKNLNRKIKDGNINLRIQIILLFDYLLFVLF